MLVPRNAHARSRTLDSAGLLGAWAALAAVSCASLPALPSAGGPRWLQLSAEHSELFTDEAEPLARKASARIEQLHAGLCKAAFHCNAGANTTAHPKLRVIALHDASQFEQLYGEPAPGAFSPELIYEPQLVLSDGFSQRSAALLTHVLARLVAEETLGPLPLWLASGLASYYETARFDAAGAFVVGDPVRRHVELLRAAGARLGAEALLNQPPTAADSAQQAASAWLLVHYLLSERRSEFEAFLSGLGSGQALAAAFHEAFPDLAPELLDALLDRYLKAGNYLAQSEHLDPPPTAAQVSALSDADVDSLRAEIAAAAPQRAEIVNAQLTLALQSQPGHVRASILRAQPGAASALAAAHPESWLAWVHLAYTQPERACSPELQEHLHALAPDNAHTLSIAGQCALHAGADQTDQALAVSLSLSRRAFAAYPSSPRIALSHARVLQAAGACAELAALRERTPLPQAQATCAGKTAP